MFVEKENIIQIRSSDFALEIIELYKKLTKEKEFVISKQLLRSSSSIGANVEEAIAGQSKRDFLSKINIALKEARESRYWLKLLQKSQLVQKDYSHYMKQATELINILSKIILTTSKSLNK